MTLEEFNDIMADKDFRQYLASFEAAGISVQLWHTDSDSEMSVMTRAGEAAIRFVDPPAGRLVPWFSSADAREFFIYVRAASAGVRCLSEDANKARWKEPGQGVPA